MVFIGSFGCLMKKKHIYHRLPLGGCKSPKGAFTRNRPKKLESVFVMFHTNITSRTFHFKKKKPRNLFV